MLSAMFVYCIWFRVEVFRIGLRIWGLGFSVTDLVGKVQGRELGVLDLRFRFWFYGSRVQGVQLRVLGVGVRG